MQSSDPETASAPGDGSPVTSPGQTASGPVHLGRLWPLALAAGLGAGVMAEAAGEAAYGFFRPAIVATPLTGGSIVDTANNATKVAAEIKNSALASALLGAAMGLTMGLAGGLARGDRRAGVRAGLVGLSLGAIAGAGTGLPLAWVYYKNQRAIVDDLFQPMLLHGGTWGAVGAVGGLAFGLGLGGRASAVRTVLGGLLGAALGTVLFELVGAVLFPLARTVQPLALSWDARMLARLSVATLAAVGAALAVDNLPERPGPAARVS
jgi:hypothetical protein